LEVMFAESVSPFEVVFALKRADLLLQEAVDLRVPLSDRLKQCFAVRELLVARDDPEGVEPQREERVCAYAVHLIAPDLFDPSLKFGGVQWLAFPDEGVK